MSLRESEREREMITISFGIDVFLLINGVVVVVVVKLSCLELIRLTLSTIDSNLLSFFLWIVLKSKNKKRIKRGLMKKYHSPGTTIFDFCCSSSVVVGFIIFGPDLISSFKWNLIRRK